MYFKIRENDEGCYYLIDANDNPMHITGFARKHDAVIAQEIAEAIMFEYVESKCKYKKIKNALPNKVPPSN